MIAAPVIAENAMPRVSEIEDAGADPLLGEMFAQERELFGGVLNPTKVFAHRPGILQAAKQLYAACDQSGLLPVPLLALVYARVAALNGCPF
jgi:alkylhydroperoxidase family enzyme